MPIPQPIQELQAPLHFLPVHLTPFCLHFLSKENFMVHHLTPNLNSSILNNLPHTPFICLTWKISSLPFLDLSSNYGVIPLVWNHTIKYVCATINLCSTTNCQSQQCMNRTHSFLQCLICTRHYLSTRNIPLKETKSPVLVEILWLFS